MLKCLKKIDKAKTGIFAAGVLFGTAGIKILSSKDAKKLYTNCTAAVFPISSFFRLMKNFIIYQKHKRPVDQNPLTFLYSCNFSFAAGVRFLGT